MKQKNWRDQNKVDPFLLSDPDSDLPEDYTRGWLPKDPIELARVRGWDNFQEECNGIGWLWRNWIAQGYVTMFAGHSGVGKSFLLLRLCGCITNNWEFPDGSHLQDENGLVLWAEGEAAQRLNYNRGKIMGLNVNKILYPFGEKYTDYDMEDNEHNQRLADSLFHPNVKLLVIDSLSGVHNGDENSSDMNRNIKFLAKLAQETKKPILISHHMKKKTVFDGNQMTSHQVRGSSAIIQNTRVVIGIDAPSRDTSYKRVQVLKSNLSEIPDPVAFQITDGQVNFVPYTEKQETQTQRNRATHFLEAALAEGPRKANDLIEEAKTQGISERTLKYAKKELGAESQKIGGSNGYHQWVLPTRSSENNKD